MKAGTVGTVGTTSFFPSKNLGCYGDGGALFVNNDELARKIRVVSNHGQTQQYVHDEIGVNSRLDTIQAAILNVKLKYLDEYAAKRLAVADFYDQAFKGLSNVQTPVRASYSSHVFHQYTLKINGTNRNELRNKLSEKGIPSMIYYPIALHLQKAYKDSRYKEGAFPVTEQLCKSVLSLPIHTEFEPEQLDYIVSNFRQLVQS